MRSDDDTRAETTVAAILTAFQYHKDLADRALTQVPDDALHRALDDETNSIAVIMQHVSGNLRSRWTDFLTTDGEKPWRHRDQEFVEQSDRSRVELMDDWNRGWACLFDALTALSPGDLDRCVTIRGESLTVPMAACRSLAHTAYHVGQIVLTARILVAQAGGQWTTLTITRGQSAQHNQRTWGQSQYKK